MKPTYGSLFTGVGGFDLGFDQAGYECRWQVEWDKNCQQVLGHHWPDVPKWGDIQDVHACTCRFVQPFYAQQCMEHVDGSSNTNQSRCACGGIEPVDIITYGSPCQDLSVAGKRAGLDGGRSSMFFEATRIFQEMRNATDGTFPRITIWENVPGALSSNNGDDFRTVLQTLDDIGALAQWWYVLDAQYFGVPQRRRRVFVISVFDPAIIERAGDGQILPVGEGRRRNPAKGNKSGEETATPIGESTSDPRAIGFNWQNGGGYGTANIGLGITPEGTGPLSISQVPAVACDGS